MTDCPLPTSKRIGAIKRGLANLIDHMEADADGETDNDLLVVDLRGLLDQAHEAEATAIRLEKRIAAMELAETVSRLVERDPHQFSKRPCQTCRTVSGLLGRAFGCEARAA